ncbi:hypothetical protein AGR9A_Lc50090 [Agrobacterium salinitolerans str. Hayward 0363]|nr:hypothetical protein AGR9A_Lc50090 [Agrobacterium salinitolerans str. Hayward 0363]
MKRPTHRLNFGSEKTACDVRDVLPEGNGWILIYTLEYSRLIEASDEAAD